MKKYLPSLFAIFFFSFYFTQTGIWSSLKNSKISNIKTNKRSINNPNLYRLNIDSLKTILSKSPKKNSKIARSSVIVSFPDSEGGIQNFSIYKYSNFSPELEAKHPEINSYYGESLDGKSSKIYFSVSPLGLYSMQLRFGKEAVFIESYDKTNTTYIVYKKSDKGITTNKFDCSTKATSAVEGLSMAKILSANDSTLRTYRMALSCTGEYAQYFGGTTSAALAAMNNTMTRINGIFENDFAIKMVLIANESNIIFLDPTTDPYSDASTGVTNELWSTELMNVLHGSTYGIGDSAFDIGHLFGASGGGGSAGCIGCVCNNNTSYDINEDWYWYKGQGFTSPADAVPSGDSFDIDFVAHELGHQFGASHTFTYAQEGSNTQVEPGSGSTIMGYAGITNQDVQTNSDPYFHAASIQQITSFVKSNSGNCSVNTATGNTAPVVSAGLDYTIPQNTPFMLTGIGSDADGDILKYCWEEMDVQNDKTTAPEATKTSGPAFRSYPPSTSSSRYFPKMSSVLAGSNYTAGTEINVEVLPTVSRTLNFRLTVRDNKANGGANAYDDMIVNVNSSYGPFTVTSQNTTGISYPQGSSQTITWNVANTSTLAANVDILLSTDGGSTWSILLAGTPNDGSQIVTIPNVTGSTCRFMVKASGNIFFNVNKNNFTISSDTQAPTAPTLSASDTNSYSTVLTWTGATDNVGITGYEIYKNGVLISTSSTSPFTVTGLTASTNYTFTVKAKDAAGNTSSSSNSVNVTTTKDIYISEYLEGSNNNKALEITNVTNATVNLSNYSIKKANNGANSWTNVLTLSGTLPSNKTFVISNQLYNLNCFGTINTTTSSLDFDGNDVIGLFNGSSLIDIIGTLGSSSYFAKDVDLRRKVTAPNTVYTPSEWDIYSFDNCSNIGIIYPISITSLILLPNPVKGETLYVMNADSSDFELFDMSGKLISQGKIENESINVRILKPGIYLIKIGEVIKRFIKE